MKSLSSDADVLMFWSDRAYAERARKRTFADTNYRVASMSLFDFLFRWLPGMEDDERLAGTNWTGDLAGLEVRPEQLADEIMDHMSVAMLDAYMQRLREKLAEQSQQRPRD